MDLLDNDENQIKQYFPRQKGSIFRKEGFNQIKYNLY